MKHSVHSRIVWVCGTLAVVSAVVWAAPGLRSGKSDGPRILTVGQSTKTRVTVPKTLTTLKNITLNNQDKLKLLESAGFTAPNGIVTKAKFTPSQPLIAKQGMINFGHVEHQSSGNPSDNTNTGWARLEGGDGYVVVAFLPSAANKPVLVIFNIWTPEGETKFDLLAGDQKQGLTLNSGEHHVACVVTPTTLDIQCATLQSTAGGEWQLESVEVIVQQ